MALYVITYQVGPVSGVKRTEAEADDVAIANVKAWVSANLPRLGDVSARVSVKIA